MVVVYQSLGILQEQSHHTMVWVDTGTLPRGFFKLKLGSEFGHLAKTIADARRARAVRIGQAKQTAKDGSDAKHLVIAKGANRIATVEAVTSADNYGAAIDV
jgi:hypothetical protein